MLSIMIPTQNLATCLLLVAGNVACLKDYYQTNSGKTVTLYIHVMPHLLDRAKYALEVLKKSMEWMKIH